ncbi:hypothetical protein NL676_030321 [Syzygium grande]|nr:hypothetical protein NL676_030321 [Syzygium grande]
MAILNMSTGTSLSKLGNYGAALARRSSARKTNMVVLPAGRKSIQASSSQEASAETVKQGVDKAEKAGENIKNIAASVTEDVSQKSKDMASNVSEATHDATEKAKQTVQNAWDSAKETAQKAKETVLEKVEDAKQSVKTNADKAQRAMKSNN